MAEQIEIYEILDPRDGSVRYIGKSNNARKRFQQHMRETRYHTPLYDWLAKMRREGLVPTYRIALLCTVDEWKQCEIDAIAAARAGGVRLLNVADGGDEPYCSHEIRSANGRKVAQARRDDPLKAYFFHVKKTLTTALREGHLMDCTKKKMRLLAQKRPDIFGAWANV